jgi:hypothetical protein
MGRMRVVKARAPAEKAAPTAIADRVRPTTRGPAQQHDKAQTAHDHMPETCCAGLNVTESVVSIDNHPRS